MKLVIVESPSKRETIQHLLETLYPQETWRVEASIGHICCMGDGGIENTGIVITEHEVRIQYQPNGKRGADTIQKLRKLATQAEEILLATDDDREGESISWHLLREVCADRPYGRIVCHEITENGVLHAFAHQRHLNSNLVDSQRTRQGMDRLIGYTVSPILIRLNQGRSAGRVQSAALRLIANRHYEIQQFKPVPYWVLSSTYQEGFTATYMGLVDTQKAVITAIDQMESVGSLTDDRRAEFDDAADGSEPRPNEIGRIFNKGDTDRLLRVARYNPHIVMDVEHRESKRNAPPPLTTSAMQQVASVKLGFSGEKTMQIAQSLFEGVTLPDGSHHGLITYHRTDSVFLAKEFCAAVQAWLMEEGRGCLVPSTHRQYQDKKGAQGAHEAIRPVNVALTPDLLKPCLSSEQFGLYQLIWSRAVASQCKPAIVIKSQITIQAGQTLWQAQGTVLESAGYTHFWANIDEDVELPAVRKDQQLDVLNIQQSERRTLAPDHFSEARLIQTLERLGIGRPSTYASIVKTLLQRQYIEKKGKLLNPTTLGLTVDTALLQYFPELVQAEFTARMEETLDKIAEGEVTWERYLSHFYFKYLTPALLRAKQEIKSRYNQSEVPCPKCSSNLVKLPSKFKNAPKPYYLRCMADGCDCILVWNASLSAWVAWQKAAEKAMQTPGKLTDFCCQVCSSPLEIHEFSLEGKTKNLLRCSAHHSRSDHRQEVYFQSSRGGYWNPNSKKEPSTGCPSRPKVKAHS